MTIWVNIYHYVLSMNVIVALGYTLLLMIVLQDTNFSFRNKHLLND